MKINRLFVLAVSLMILLMALIIPTKVQADSLPFSVQTVLPDEQRDTSESYFDVVVASGKTAALTVKLKNTTNKAVKVDVKINAAQTASSGIVDYNPAKVAANLPYKLTDYLKGKTAVTIPASGTYVYKATLTMPQKTMNGLMVGGLIFSPATDDSESTQKSGVSVTNKYNYVIAVIARDTDRTWSPSMTLGAATIKQTNYQNTVAVPITNTSGTFLNQLHVETTAVNQTTGKKYHRTASDMQMAPNSTFDYAVNLPKKAQAGQYKVQTKAYFVKNASGKYQDASGTHYQYMKMSATTVTLTAKKAKAMTNKLKVTKVGTPWYVYAIIGAFVVLMLVIVGLVILLLRRKK